MSDILKIPSQLEPLIPLSHLELDLEPSTAGWAADLATKGVAIELDDLGRASIPRQVARQLIAERREARAAAEVRARELAEQNDAWHAEQYRLNARPGVPAHLIPEGVSAAAAMVQAGKDAEPQTVPSDTEWMFGEVDTMVYQPFPQEGE
jgi:hypothetical protein